MKKNLILVALLSLAAGFTLAYAANVDSGKALFENPHFAGSTNEDSCMTCHSDGDDFGSDLFERKNFKIMGMKKNSLAEVINVCIEQPLEGKAIDPQGEEMMDLSSYLKTLISK